MQRRERRREVRNRSGRAPEVRRAGKERTGQRPCGQLPAVEAQSSGPSRSPAAPGLPQNPAELAWAEGHRSACARRARPGRLRGPARTRAPALETHRPVFERSRR